MGRIEMLCNECQQEIGSSPMYAKIEAGIDEVGEIVVETKYYYKEAECLQWLKERVDKKKTECLASLTELLDPELFRSSN